ncbi:hypothetical protein Deval_1900 [Nitratidesulfovibrio vulgaris RCH1]|nr:hypothetical protein Deval_1900 [Nitratidesulfovibrio vulgaris RCH1]
MFWSKPCSYWRCHFCFLMPPECFLLRACPRQTRLMKEDL